MVVRAQCPEAGLAFLWVSMCPMVIFRVAELPVREKVSKHEFILLEDSSYQWPLAGMKCQVCIQGMWMGECVGE